MKTYLLKVLLPGVVAASALTYAASAGAQTPAPAATPATPPATQAAPMGGHHKGHADRTKQHADMKAECQAMMAKRQAMQAKLAAMDVDLDRAVAEMNAAKGSKTVDALEKPMMGVINELVAQHKAARSMMMEMQPAMMAHMMKHMDGRGGRGGMSCPMMKDGAPSEPKTDAKTPKM